MDPKKNSFKRTWIEINSTKMLNNFRKMKNAYGHNQKVGVMLKANAYGHGLMESISILRNVSDMIYVLEANDALQIRRIEKESNLPQLEIAVVGNINQEEAIELAKENVAFTILNESFITWNRKAFQNTPEVRVYVFVDTGLGREGLRYNDIKIIEEIKQFDNLHLEGVMTHFSNAEHDGPPVYAKLQFQRFKEASKKISELAEVPYNQLVLHTSASMPSLLYPEARLDIVRLGISLFGYWTSPESEIIAQYKYPDLDLEPILTWKAEAISIKKIPKGDFIGYDCAYKCRRDTYVAVFQVGYYDGYPYYSDKIVDILIDGVRCPILGNVMMNCIVVDITDIHLKQPNKIIATLIGQDGDESISADDLAKINNMTNYNVLASISPFIERVIVS